MVPESPLPESKPLPPDTKVKTSSNVPYLVAIVVMFLVAVAGVVLMIILVPDAEITIVVAAVFGALTPTTMALLALMKSQETSAMARLAAIQSQETHLSVNSRLDELIKNAKLAAMAEGEKIGREAAEARTDELAKNPAPKP